MSLPETAIGRGPRRKGSAQVWWSTRKRSHFTKKSTTKGGQATSLQYSPRLYETQGDYRKAFENYSAALALWREVPDRRGEGYATSNIGTMHLYLGDLKLAYASFQKAQVIYRDVGNREGEALCYQEIGNVYRQQGDFVRALEYFRQSVSIFREVGAKGRVPYVLSNMGVAYRGHLISMQAVSGRWGQTSTSIAFCTLLLMDYLTLPDLNCPEWCSRFTTNAERRETASSG